jgi:hypothetical protein
MPENPEPTLQTGTLSLRARRGNPLGGIGAMVALGEVVGSGQYG